MYPNFFEQILTQLCSSIMGNSSIKLRVNNSNKNAHMKEKKKKTKQFHQEKLAHSKCQV